MKKEKGKQIKFIISLISIGIFVYSYFVIYSGYENKTIEAYKEIDLIKLQIREREKMLIQEEELDASLEEINNTKQEIIDRYPVHIAKEDNFMFVERLQNSLRLNITSVDITDNTGFYKTILPALSVDSDNENQEEGSDSEKDEKDMANEETATMNGMVNTITLGFLTSYDGFKELSEYIRNYPEPTVIDKVSISYDSSTGSLAGNLTLKRFALTGTGKEYKGTYIDGINIGTDNIFGTGDFPGYDDEILEQDGEITEPEG